MMVLLVFSMRQEKGSLIVLTVAGIAVGTRFVCGVGVDSVNLVYTLFTPALLSKKA